MDIHRAEVISVKRVFLILAIVLVLPAASSFSTEPPQRVYGNITSDGASVSGVEVSLRNQDLLASTQTSENGFYSMNIDSSEQSVYLFVNGENTSKQVLAETGGSTNIQHEGDISTQPLDASFTLEKTGSRTVSVEASSSASNYYWRWSSGSGFSELGPTASHTYSSDGSYTVTLEAGDGSENVSVSKTVEFGSSENGDGGDNGDSDGSDGSDGGGGGGGIGSIGTEPDRPEGPKRVQIEPSETLEIELERSGRVLKLVDDGVLKSLSFAPEQDSFSVEVSIPNPVDRPPEDLEVYSFLSYSLGTEVSGKTLEMRVRKSWLEDRDAGIQDMKLYEYTSGEWREKDLSVVSESISFHTVETQPGSDLVALGASVPQNTSPEPEPEPEPVSEPDIGISDIEVAKVNASGGASVSLRAINSGNAAGTQTVRIGSGGETYLERSLTLEPGEEKSLNWTGNLGIGNHTISVAGTSRDLAFPRESGGLPLVPVAGALSVLLLLALGFHIYRRETRKAEELQSTIEDIREGGDEDRLDRLERDIRRVRRKFDEEVNSG